MLIDAPLNIITGQIIGAAIEVHRILGPGLLESTYMPCLQFELATGKLRFVTDQLQCAKTDRRVKRFINPLGGDGDCESSKQLPRP